MITWLLESGAVKQSFADWGFEGAVIDERSLAAGSAAWRANNTPVDEAPQLAWGDAVKIIRLEDGVETIWWQGRIDQLPRTGDDTREGMDYVAADPWWHLEDLTFQQGWTVDNGAGATLLNKSRVFLGVSITGDKETTKQTLENILTFARDVAGRPIDFDLSQFTGADAPVDIRLDYKCADLIRHVLQWTIDAVSWWDFTTTTPTLHIARRAALTPVSLAIPAGDDSYTIKIPGLAPRPELQVQAVVINMEQTNTINGVANLQVFLDKAPHPGVTGFEERAIVETMQFDGSQTNYVSAAVETETPAFTTLAFWRNKCPELNDDRFDEFSFVGSPTRTGTLPRIVTRGQIASWMKNPAGDAIGSERIQFKATIRYKRFYSNPNAPGAPSRESLFVRDMEEVKVFSALATDATTGTYSVKASVAYAEPLPVGLAQVIYDSASVLQFEGSVVLTEAECSGLIRLSNTLNLTGGDPDWATMNALPQAISQHLDTGQTTVAVGPSPTLNMHTLVDLIRANQMRNVYINPAVRQTGESFGGSSVQFASDNADDSAGNASHQEHRLRIGDAATATKGAIDLDPTRADVTSGTGRVLKPRWTKVCDDGVEKYCLVLRSEALTSLPAGAVVD